MGLIASEVGCWLQKLTLLRVRRTLPSALPSIDTESCNLHCAERSYFYFQLLHPDKRREYLYQLQEFLVTDNSRNWRFRAELAEYVAPEVSVGVTFSAVLFWVFFKLESTNYISSNAIDQSFIVAAYSFVFNYGFTVVFLHLASCHTTN